MDIKMHRIGGGWHVSSVGMLKVPGTSEVIDTELEFIVEDGVKTKVSDDDSEGNSSDESAVLSCKKSEDQKSTSPDIIVKNEDNETVTASSSATTNFQNLVRKERKISRIIKNMRISSIFVISYMPSLVMGFKNKLWSFFCYLKTSTVKEMADFIIYPDGALSYYWMSLTTLAVMYNLAVVILRLAFTDVRDQRIFFLLDNITDVIYIVDILVQSRTAFLEDGCLVLDPRAMYQNYRKKAKYWLDIAAIFPVTTIYWTLNVLMNAVTFNFSTIFLVTPLPGFRFLRILKYHQVTSFFEIADSRTRRPSLLRAFKLSLHLWMVIHWIACIYYMVSEFEGRGTNDWVYTKDEEGGFRRKYIRSVYWSMMTLTTIGERPSPETDLEYIFTGMTFLIGVFVFAAVVGNVGDVISNMNAARHDFQSRMDQIKFYMNHRFVPEDLQDRVKKWAEYSWTRTQAMDEPSVLAMLPDRLRTEIAIHVHLDTLKQVKIFEECEEGLLRELVLKLRPIIYSPGDYICKTGEIGREMYIINHGKIEILVQKGELSTRVALLKPGNYFGEISLLKLDDGQNRRTADVRAIGYSELLCLSRKDLISALGEYPDAKKILEAQAMKRMQETKGVRQTDKSPSPTNTSSKAPEFPKRKASDVFSQVMKQEGFRKLLSSRDNEMQELKKMVAEMRDISRRQTDPGNGVLEDKCRIMEQKIASKDMALKQAKRRINQLETYVRIRAYNAKFQRANVPASDPIVQPPKVIRQTSITNGVPRSRKLSGNLPVYNGHNSDRDSCKSDHQSSLAKESIISEKHQNGYNHFTNGHETRDKSHTSERNGVHANANPDHNQHRHQQHYGQYILNGGHPKEHHHVNGSSHFSDIRHHGLTFCSKSNFFQNSPPTVTQSRLTNAADEINAFTSIPPPHQRVLKSCKSFENPKMKSFDHTDRSKLKSWSSAESLIPRHSISTRIISKDKIQNEKTQTTEISKVNDIVTNSGTHISTASFMVNTPAVKSEISNEDSFDKDCVQTSSDKKLRSFITNIKFSRTKAGKSDSSELQNGDSAVKKSPKGSPRPLLKFCKRNSEETIDSGISDKDEVNEEELLRLMEIISKDQSLDSINTSLSENDSDIDSDADFE